MPAASNTQVQNFVNTRLRVHCEQIRALLISLKDDKAVIDDIYANVSDAGTTFTDTRDDAPPHLMSPTDILAYNSYVTALINNIENAADYATIVKACVRPVLA